jgi:hypothetical protein
MKSNNFPADAGLSGKHRRTIHEPNTPDFGKESAINAG